MNQIYQGVLNLLNNGQLDDARQFYTELLREHDDAKVVLNDIGVSFFLRNDRKKALTYYEAALLVDPRFAIAYLHRGYERTQAMENTVPYIHNGKKQTPEGPSGSTISHPILGNTPSPCSALRPS